MFCLQMNGNKASIFCTDERKSWCVASYDQDDQTGTNSRPTFSRVDRLKFGFSGVFISWWASLTSDIWRLINSQGPYNCRNIQCTVPFTRSQCLLIICSQNFIFWYYKRNAALSWGTWTHHSGRLNPGRAAECDWGCGHCTLTSLIAMSLIYDLSLKMLHWLLAVEVRENTRCPVPF